MAATGIAKIIFPTRPDPPVEESTYVVPVQLKDEAEVAVVPKKMAWNLCDKSGVPMDGFKNQEITTLAEENKILISKDAFILSTNEKGIRFLTVRMLYDSDLRDDMETVEEERLNIKNLVGAIPSFTEPTTGIDYDVVLGDIYTEVLGEKYEADLV